MNGAPTSHSTIATYRVPRAVARQKQAQ